jgi:hypothetical protein
MASPAAAEWMTRLHPLRLQYEMFSEANPLMRAMAPLAEWAGENRAPAAHDNPFSALQDEISSQIIASLDRWREARDAWAEQVFFAVYGSPIVQAMAGIDPSAAGSMRQAGKSRLHGELLRARIAELRSHIPLGGVREAAIRSLLYVGMARRGVDERGFEMVQRIRRNHTDMPLSAFKALVREQYFMLLIDPEASLAALPAMVPEAADRIRTLDFVRQVLSAREGISGEAIERLERIHRLFGVDAGAAAASALTTLTTKGKMQARKAS